jgi:hypothetical protein
MEYIKSYEYEGNVNPKMENIPIVSKNINSCDYGITFIDFGDIYHVSYKATSPNLLASFIKIDKQNPCDKLLEFDDSCMNASSHLFYIINGDCEITLDDSETFKVSCGGIFIAPFFNSIKIVNKTDEDLLVYYINDSPLLNYLGSEANKRIFSCWRRT